jgi:hypothetical protein
MSEYDEYKCAEFCPPLRLGSPSTVCHVSGAQWFRAEDSRWGWGGV